MQSAGLDGSVKMQIHNVGVEECFSIPWDELQVMLLAKFVLFVSTGDFFSFDWGFLLACVFSFLLFSK